MTKQTAKKTEIGVVLDRSAYDFYAKEAKNRRTTPEKIMAKVIHEYVQRAGG